MLFFVPLVLSTFEYFLIIFVVFSVGRQTPTNKKCIQSCEPQIADYVCSIFYFLLFVTYSLCIIY